MRDYPLARQLLAHVLGDRVILPSPEHNADPLSEIPSDAASSEAPLQMPHRPAHIRPGISRAQHDAAELTDVLLQQTADSAMWVNHPDGASSFEINMHEGLLTDDAMRCRITIGKDGIVAVFVVQDRNLQRLLEAESGRLRVALEARGFKGVQVQVVTADPDGIGDALSR